MMIHIFEPMHLSTNSSGNSVDGFVNVEVVICTARAVCVSVDAQIGHKTGLLFHPHVHDKNTTDRSAFIRVHGKCKMIRSQCLYIQLILWRGVWITIYKSGWAGVRMYSGG
jgi:hypothetical protein